MKPTLNSAQRVREHEGVILTTTPYSRNPTLDKRPLVRGQECNKKVQGHPGHGTGSSRVHMWAELVEALLDEPKMDEKMDKWVYAVLKNYKTERLDVQTREEFASETKNYVKAN